MCSVLSFWICICIHFFLATAQAELAKPVEGTRSAPGSPSCDQEYSELGCASFENEPDLKDKMRDCNKKVELVDQSSVLKSCLSSGLSAWKDLAASLLNSPAAIANSVIGNLQEQAKAPVALAAFKKKCLSDIECKKNVFRAGYGREPNFAETSELENYEKGWIPAPIVRMSTLWEKATANQFSKTGTRSPWMDSKLKEIFGPPKADPPPEVWKKAKELLNSQYRKFKCLNPTGQTEMACYAFFSALDPALAYGVASKVPRLAKLIEASKTGSAKTTGVQATGRTDAAAQEVERLRNLSPQERSQMLASAGALSDADRIKSAEQAIAGVSQRQLTPAQRDAVLGAHNVGGSGRNYNYSASELREKAEILKKAGFSDAETQVLMRRGITGRGDGMETVRFGSDQSGRNTIAKVSEGDEILKWSDSPAKIGEAKRFFSNNAELALRQSRFQDARHDFIRAGDIGGYASTIRTPAKAQEELALRTSELKALKTEMDLPRGRTGHKPTDSYYRTQVAHYEEAIRHLRAVINDGP